MHNTHLFLGVFGTALPAIRFVWGMISDGDAERARREAGGCRLIAGSFGDGAKSDGRTAAADFLSDVAKMADLDLPAYWGDVKPAPAPGGGSGGR